MINIRRALPSEVKKLQNLNDEAFAANPSFDPDLILDWAQSSLGESYFADLLSNPDKHCLVAEDGDKLVGYIAAGPKEIAHRKSKYIEIENLGVTPDYRKQGVASDLMAECLEWAKSKGYQKVYLDCYAKNKPALNFYEASGFSPIDIGLEKTL